MHSALRSLTLVTALTTCAGLAQAHISLTSPQKRYDSQKSGPCGLLNGPKTTNVSVFKPGETITVTWDETINHPGHYRISFDADGDDDFVDPASFTDVNSAPSVLLDDIADKSGGSYSAQVTLPNVECESCTLQLIQVMTDKPPYGDGNDIYYQCADIALRADQDAGSGGSAGAGGAGTGGTTATGGAGTGAGGTGAAGAGGAGAAGSAGASGSPSAGSGSGDDGGCSMTAPAQPGGLAWLGVLAALGALWRRRR